MAKVRTLSRKFMKGHPRYGKDTLFVEKVLNSLEIDFHSSKYLRLLEKLNPKLNSNDLICFFMSLGFPVDTTDIKPHTIRSGHHFKKGDKIQLAVWSRKPYASPQIKICPAIEVKEVYDFNISDDYSGIYWIQFGHKYYHREGMDINLSILPTVAKNDGLSLLDFLSWFKYPSYFDGQIICWKDVKY